MKKNFRLIMAAVLAVFSLAATAFLTTEVRAENAFTKEICSNSAYSAEQKAAAGCDEERTAGSVATGVINVVLGVIGIAAVIALIYGGAKYAISVSRSDKVTQAKNIILYAVIGLVVSLLAYAIVNFVLAGVLNGSAGPVATGGSSSGGSSGSSSSSSSSSSGSSSSGSGNTDDDSASTTDKLKGLCSDWGGTWKAKDSALPKRCVNLAKKRKSACENNDIKKGTFVEIKSGEYKGKYRCQWGKAAKGGGGTVDVEPNGGGGR